MVIEIHIEIPIGIKADHLVETDIQDLPVDHLDRGIIERTETEIEIGTEIETETIEGIGVYPMMVMKTQDLEVVQELDITLT